jgi:hypothetical protein
MRTGLRSATKGVPKAPGRSARTRVVSVASVSYGEDRFEEEREAGSLFDIVVAM